MNIISRLKDKFATTPAYTTALMVSLVVLLAGTIAFSLLAQAVQRQNSIDYRNRMDRQTSALSVHTDNVIRSYNKLLHAGAATVNLETTTNQEVWRRLYRDMKVADDYPELIGLGYASYVRASDKDDFEQTMRESVKSDFTLNPQNGQDEFVAITHIEPMDAANVSAIGYDMNSESARHAAIIAARDGASATLTAPVKLVQDQIDTDNDHAEDNGVLMYYPVYATRDIPDSVTERRAQLKGYVYLVLRPTDLLQHYIDTTPLFAENVNITVKDTATDMTLYSARDAVGIDTNLVRQEELVYLDGRQWQFTIAGREPYIIRTGSPMLIVVLGLFASAVGAIITFRTLLARMRSLERSYEEEVQRSKEELLALASHQLRTPASGVKQYLGLLQDGFVGELNEKQQEVTQKAIDANERQLNIINELLYISKIDAGQLQLEKHDVNLTQLTASVVDGFATQAKGKDITIAFKTKRAFVISIDDRYIRMVVENLISNAIKYSRPETTIRVSLRQRDDTLELLVADKGVGIEATDQQRIFQKFERIKNELSRSEGGSGLGLFLARQLAQAHGGDISVQSRPGKGSTFILELPVVTTDEESHE